MKHITYCKLYQNTCNNTHLKNAAKLKREGKSKEKEVGAREKQHCFQTHLNGTRKKAWRLFCCQWQSLHTITINVTGSLRQCLRVCCDGEKRVIWGDVNSHSEGGGGGAQNLKQGGKGGGGGGGGQAARGPPGGGGGGGG